MKVLHHMKKENSGLARTTLEIVKYEEKQGHKVCIKEPTGEMPIYGSMNGDPDIHCIHSQLGLKAYHDNKPKVMFMHGEPLSSVGNGVSMKAIVDLAPMVDCFIAMRKDEMPIWQSIKRTYLVDKGVDLEVYKPLDGITEKLSGEPSVLYVENWRGQRNPLYLCVAMEQVWKKYPNARLHLYNCNDKRMQETFLALSKNNKWWPFLRSLQGGVNGGEEMNLLYNRADIVVSCLYPLYARSVEAFGAGKAFIGPGYKEHNYPWQCDLHPDSIAKAIIDCWENFDKIDYRKWAEKYHDANESARQCVEIYKRYL
jgi:glycosyltransferase involved in cell wall biosynthesis